MNDYAIKVNNLSKSFRIAKQTGIKSLFKRSSKLQSDECFKALDNVSFEVKKGEVLSIIGLNGSGKTSLLRLIAGIYRPDEGTIETHGRLSPVMQLAVGFSEDLDARENIIMNGLLLGMSKSTIESKVDEIIKFAELKNFMNLKLRHFSSGMKARLGFSISLQIQADILLVDEILSVGDKEFKEKSFDAFLSLKKEGKTILHVTHGLEKIEKFSDRVLLLNKGKKVMIGEPKEVIKKYMEIHTK